MAYRVAWLCVGLVCSLAMVGCVREGVIPRGVPTDPWKEELGHHRARIRVSRAADAVQVTVRWRRRDHDADTKDVIIIDTATGQRVANVVRVAIDREQGTLVFQPHTAPGAYDVYYMPAPRPQPDVYTYEWDYFTPEAIADPDWVRRCRLTTHDLARGAWRGLPSAEVVRIEARTEFDRFDPMEVVATMAETEDLLRRYPDPYLVFPADRKVPIRMPDDLPLRWVTAGPATQFCGEAGRNEFYVFQIGIWAARQALDGVEVEFSDLRSAGGAAIPASAMRCFNVGGVNSGGHLFGKTVAVRRGKVQPLWIGVQIPKDAAPGEYRGKVTIRPANAEAAAVDVCLTVRCEVVEDSGDGEPWRHSRLRWLDSRLGIDDDVVPPYTPLERDGQTIRCLGRRLRFADSGLPESICCDDREVLVSPIRFAIETHSGPLALSWATPKWVKDAPGVAVCESAGSSGPVTLACRTTMECDGHISFVLSVKADRTVRVKDMRLEIPVSREASTYLMGIGRLGGYRPKKHTWTWEGPYNSLWIGDVHAGLHCKLYGTTYHGPLLNQYRPKPPASWSNSGRGGVTVQDAECGGALVKVSSGERDLAGGHELDFEFALLVTPVKPLDPAAHFREHYERGCMVTHLHHSEPPNPYINYPFVVVDRTRAYVKARHEENRKLRIYYTVRELTNYATEIWALRSLGDEVIADGQGGGHTWLREHLVAHYTPNWFTYLADGTSDAAVVMSPSSRWHNYYVEGLQWMLGNLDIDGLYLDDVAYDRTILKRMRKVMERHRPGLLLDLHSNTGFSFGPANQYAEFFPYLTSVWLGEGFKHNEMSPDQWLVEATGIPFGVMGDILSQFGHSPFQGMVYGMTDRSSAPLWTLWKDFDIAESVMIGYWEPDCPVRTDHPDVLATAYVKDGETMVALASWAERPAKVRLSIDWEKLGLDPGKARLLAPVIRGQDVKQDAAVLEPTDEIAVRPTKGWLLIIRADEETGNEKDPV